MAATRGHGRNLYRKEAAWELKRFPTAAGSGSSLRHVLQAQRTIPSRLEAENNLGYRQVIPLVDQRDFTATNRIQLLACIPAALSLAQHSNQPGFVHSHSLSHLKPSLGYKTAPLHLRQHLACIRASLRWLPQNMPISVVSQNLEFCPIPLLVPLCTSKCVSCAPCTSLSSDLPVPTVGSDGISKVNMALFVCPGFRRQVWRLSRIVCCLQSARGACVCQSLSQRGVVQLTHTYA